MHSNLVFCEIYTVKVNTQPNYLWLFKENKKKSTGFWRLLKIKTATTYQFQDRLTKLIFFKSPKLCRDEKILINVPSMYLKRFWLIFL